MDFLSPWSLAGLVLVPAIFLWGLLAPRGRPVTVGSLMLWRRALGAGPAGKPSARVRLRDPLLWLDAAAVMFLVAACARPAIRTTAAAQPVATLVVDRTASMDVDLGEGSRWEHAHGLAAALLKKVGDLPLRVVFVPGDSGSIQAEETRSGRLLAEGAAPWRPVLAALDVWPAAIAESASQSERPVLVVTDVAPAATLPPNVYVLATGGRSENVGLQRVAVRTEGKRAWVLVSAKAAPEAKGPYALQVSSSWPGKTMEIPNFLSPGTTVERVVALEAPPVGGLTVQLDGPQGDGFTADNAAYLSAEPGEPIKVLLIGKEDHSLRRALAARDDVVVVEGLPDAKAIVDRTHLVIANEAPLPADWTGPAIVIMPPGPIGPVTPAEGEAAGEWRVAPDGPLADVLRRDPPRIGSVRHYTVAKGGQLLLGTPEAPLMVAWGSQGSRRLAVLFGFDERTTDWPHRVGFPLFWSHAFDWLVPGYSRAAAYKTYRPFEFARKLGKLAPDKLGFWEEGGIGVSFIGTDEGFQAGTGRDDSAAATEAIRRAAESARRAAFYDLWPLVAAAALLALLVRVRVAR